MTQKSDFNSEIVSIDKLTPHPGNYRKHPPEQLDHIVKSIEDNGFYRNIVISKDNFILAGHGVVEASKQMGINQVPVIRVKFNHDEVKAKKILIGDNEISHLGIISDRNLSDMLKEIKEADIDGLLGTGYTDEMLANLVFISRNRSEIKDMDEASHWTGMPEFDIGEFPYILKVKFKNKEDMEAFINKSDLDLNRVEKSEKAWSARWPDQEKDDISSVRIDADEA